MLGRVERGRIRKTEVDSKYEETLNKKGSGRVYSKEKTSVHDKYPEI